jgi:hypothetical protein
MQPHLAFVLPVLGLLLLPSCSLVVQQRWRSALHHMQQIFAQCETQHLHDRAAQWTETVRCGNDGARAILAHSRSPYADLIAAVLASRLAIAQQIDADSGPFPSALAMRTLSTATSRLRMRHTSWRCGTVWRQESLPFLPPSQRTAGTRGPLTSTPRLGKARVVSSDRSDALWVSGVLAGAH